MMSERFYIHCGDDINKQLMDTESDFNIHVEEIGSDEELIRLCNLLNKQQDTIGEQKIAIDELITDYKKLEKENEQLRKQIQNYKQLISNSYVGEEETLDGFVGKYVIWENELQKYKNKNEMIDNE